MGFAPAEGGSMQISSKCYYALRALFELASQYRHSRPVKVFEIAASQRIPRRFLEVILSELRQGGFVESRRGAEGGYILARSPETISVGEVVRFVDGDIAPVSCVSTRAGEAACELNFQCPFYDFWLRAVKAVGAVYDGTSLADILTGWQEKTAGAIPHYEI
jgi:Rrf2 family transcriptional regulator, cysteine metabolism repressor